MMPREDLDATGQRMGDDAVLARLDQAEPHHPNFGIPITFDGEGNVDPGEELIKRMLPFAPGFLAFIAGQSQAGKSFFAVRQAICLASGEPFFGYPVREKVGVIYVAAEGEGAIDRRFKVAKDDLGITRKLPIATLKVRPNLLDKKSRTTLTDKAKRVADYMIRTRMCARIGITYIDTVAASTIMSDENNNAEITVVCGHLRDFGHQLGCVMSPLIHLGKNEGAGIRGGSNWTGHGDLVASIFADRDKSGKAENRRIAISKHRDGEEGPISGFDLRFVELGKHPLYGDPYGSCVMEPNEADWRAKKTASKTNVTFEEAFNEIALTHAVKRPVHLDGPMVDAVRTATVRSEFMRRHGTGEGDPAKAQVARRQAWKRAYDAATKKHRTHATETDAGGEEWLWKA